MKKRIARTTLTSSALKRSRRSCGERAIRNDGDAVNNVDCWGFLLGVESVIIATSPAGWLSQSNQELLAVCVRVVFIPIDGTGSAVIATSSVAAAAARTVASEAGVCLEEAKLPMEQSNRHFAW